MDSVKPAPEFLGGLWADDESLSCENHYNEIRRQLSHACFTSLRPRGRILVDEMFGTCSEWHLSVPAYRSRQLSGTGSVIGFQAVGRWKLCVTAKPGHQFPVTPEDFPPKSRAWTGHPAFKKEYPKSHWRDLGYAEVAFDRAFPLMASAAQAP